MLDIFRKRRMWRPRPDLKKRYDVVIVGGGAHGLATAYYLKQRGITDVAVLEKSYIGSGAAGRNTTILRSNYKTPEGARFYDASVKLYEGLSKELNFNLLFSQCGHLTLAHTDRAMFVMANRAEVNRLDGIDTRVIGPERGAEARARDARLRRRRAPDHGRALPPARRHHPPRRRGLGLRPRRRRGRRGDPPVHRGHRLRARQRPHHRRRDHPRPRRVRHRDQRDRGLEHAGQRHGRASRSRSRRTSCRPASRSRSSRSSTWSSSPRRCTSTSRRPTAASSSWARRSSRGRRTA